MVSLIFLVLNLSTLLISGAYDVPVKYFVNCGSAGNISDTRRSFVGDEKPSHFSVVNRKASVAVAADNSISLSGIHRSARIFRGNSSYGFPTETPDATAIYLVRLHFFAFASPEHLSAAVFDVAVDSGLLLLRNFTGELAVEVPVVKEFQVTAKTGKFRVHFLPRGSSFAFVNAIEVFPAPPTSFDVSDATKVGEKAPEKSPVLETVYRINVGGGKEIEPGEDDIWRRWGTDDEFLKTKENATKNTSSPGLKLLYYYTDGEFAAPDYVYRTAKEMNIVNGSWFNITWGFEVNESASHIVRAHFCDIISSSNNVLVFKLYINGGFSQVINITETAKAEYYDFAVGSSGSSDLRISIGPSEDSYTKNAYLNGLEILEVKVGSVSVLAVKDEPAGKPKLAVVIGSAAGGSVLALCALVVGFIAVRRRRQKAKPAEHSSWGHVGGLGGGSSHSRVTEATTNGSRSPFMYLGLRLSLSEIRAATKNFSPKLVIGKGGFGIVYKGTFANGTVVAVKQSKPGMDQGPMEFETEITILSKIRHRHLVSLIGYCDEQGEMILVYEFMENGTLRDHLYRSGAGPTGRLTWKQRLEICIDSAKGLEYLHKGSAGGIIHRDVKTTNILLDTNFVAKVADFGLSKSTPPEEETHISTAVKGTLGYLDPEYFLLRHLTDKSDVYSFGVVLLEVLCARAPIEQSLPRERWNLRQWAVKCLEKGAIEKIVDPTIPGRVDPNSLRKFAETAVKCLQEDGVDRPAMGDVKWDLEYALQLQQMPTTREPYEDSTATGSSFFATGDMILPSAQRLPSLSTLCDDDDEDKTCVGDERDFSDATGGTGVFSQLATDGAR